MENEQTTTASRLWLIYFPRAAHHLFMRVFSDQRNLKMIEAPTYMMPVVEPTLNLSSQISLDAAKEDCESLRQTMTACFEAWTQEVQHQEQQEKRVMNSYSVAFYISPAVHRQWLNYWQGRSPGPIASSIKDEVAHTSTASPALPSYWYLDRSSTNPMNLTIFSDSMLRSHIPILLIRHPALAFPSTVGAASAYFGLQVGDAFMDLMLRYKWLKLIYDWYITNDSAPAPMVLDADDLMYNPAAVAELCRRTGLDVDKVRHEWTPKTNGGMNLGYEKEDVFLNTLAASSGIVKGKGSEKIDVEVEAEKWKSEFGQERAMKLRRLVDDAMEDYLFLRERSLGAQLRA